MKLEVHVINLVVEKVELHLMFLIFLVMDLNEISSKGLVDCQDC